MIGWCRFLGGLLMDCYCLDRLGGSNHLGGGDDDDSRLGDDGTYSH